MATSPKSRGLGNISPIVNRSKITSPVKPVAKMPVPKPVTTTFAQRQAAPSPFRSATKPVAKVNPLQQAMQPQPFNPNPNPGSNPNPGIQIRDASYRPGRDYEVGGPNDPLVQARMPQPTILEPMYDITDFIQQPGIKGPGPAPGEDPGEYYSRNPNEIMPGDTMPNSFNPSMLNPGDYGYGQLQSGQQGMNMFGGGFGNSLAQGIAGSFGSMLGNYGGQALQAGQQPMFGNPNQMTSDYDQLEGSAFNTNPSMGGSMFGGGGFAGK